MHPDETGHEAVIRRHHGQVDKSGLLYVFHPFHLAEQMEDELTPVAVLLHDVVEDYEGKIGNDVLLITDETPKMTEQTKDNISSY